VIHASYAGTTAWATSAGTFSLTVSG
jgi:hypothetical protein